MYQVILSDVFCAPPQTPGVLGPLCTRSVVHTVDPLVRTGMALSQSALRAALKAASVLMDWSLWTLPIPNASILMSVPLHSALGIRCSLHVVVPVPRPVRTRIRSFPAHCSVYQVIDVCCAGMYVRRALDYGLKYVLYYSNGLRSYNSMLLLSISLVQACT